MKDFRKPSSIWLGLSVLLLALIVFLGEFGLEEPTQIKPKKAASTEEVSNNASVVERKPIADLREAEHVHGTDDSNHENSEDKVIRHQGMLSDEMKQAIRDKLLLHGPMEVIHHPDGRSELPSNGRFIQIPVAVKRADGSIEIKEYSTLPE